MVDAAAPKHSYIGSATANVSQDDSHLSFLWRQYRFAASQGFQNEVINLNANSADTFDQVLH